MAVVPTDSFHTVRGLCARIKRDSGESRAPVGEKQIREAIARGDLAASLEGNRYVIAWSAWCDYLQRRASVREPCAPASRYERVDTDVRDRLRHEAERTRG
jgi:hypothetical protein